VRMPDWLAELPQNLSYSLRTLRHNPGFTAVALLTLALAIGANTAIFGVTNAVLLRPPPYGQPDRLVAVYENNVPDQSPRNQLSAADITDYRASQRSLTGLGAFAGGQYTYTDPHADPMVLLGLQVSADMFGVLQAGALHGRTFAADEDSPAKKHVAVLSYSLWQRGFAGDPSVVGRSITLNDESYAVIGIMPQAFSLGYREDLWLPLDLSPVLADANRARKFHNLFAIGRLRPGATISTARAYLLGIAHRLETEYPEANTGHLVTLMPLQTAMTGDVRPAILLLTAAAALVLLVACANITNVTLARTMARRREMAVRGAIGAGRGRLVRQLLTESVLLALTGGIFGFAVASIGTRFLLSLSPGTLPPLVHVSIGGTVLLFATIVSLCTGLAFGLIPALDGSRAELHEALKSGGRATGGGAGVRRILVVAQVALAMVMLVGAGLLVRSFDALQRVNMGFSSGHVLTAQLVMQKHRYDSLAVVNQFYSGLFARLRATPGVEAVGAVSGLPLRGSSTCSLMAERHPARLDQLPSVHCMGARGRYFETLRVPLVRGRFFSESDLPGNAVAVVINETMAQRFWPGEDPIGQRMRLGPNPSAPWEMVVGVVGDMRYEGMGQGPEPTAFEFDEQQPWGSLGIVVRTTGDPARAEGALRGALREVDPTIGVQDVRPMDDILGSSLAARRFAMALISAFAFVALALAAIGVYGVLAYSVTSRTREFGIRMALGASTHSVLGLVLRQGLGWSLIGLALGVAGAFVAGRSLRAYLFGIQATDAVTFAAVACGLLAAVAAACVVPARRAVRVDPMQAMRED
jgi:putative ABC transport system permease protein